MLFQKDENHNIIRTVPDGLVQAEIEHFKGTATLKTSESEMQALIKICYLPESLSISNVK